MDAPIFVDGKLLRKLERKIRDTSALQTGFSDFTSEVLRHGLAWTTKTAKNVGLMLRRKQYGKVDDFFFSAEDLPLGGKQYWFFNLLSTRGDRTQLVLTYGSSDLKTKVNRQTAAGEKVAAIGWLFRKKRKVFLEKALKLENGKDFLKTSEFEFHGSYPSYELKIGKKTKIRFSKPKRGIPYEEQDFFVSAVGVGILNYYLDAHGILDGKRFDGVSYLQKVAVVAPFIPWNWVRLVFPDRSVLDFFEARLAKGAHGPAVHHSATFRLTSGRTHKLQDARIERLAAGRWLVKGRDFEAYMKTYASYPFVFRGRGEFHYDEYLVECEDFVFKNQSKKGGIGIVEDAYGFMI